MSKLYFLVPHLECAGAIVQALKHHGLKDDDIAFVARTESTRLRLSETIPDEAGDVRSDLASDVTVDDRYLLGGLDVKVVSGGFLVGGAALAGVVLAGGAFGAWVSALVGVSIPHDEIAALEQAIDAGELLMIVHTGVRDRSYIKQLVADHHPAVLFGGEETAIPYVY